MQTRYQCAHALAASSSLEEQAGQLCAGLAMFRLGLQVTDKVRLARPSPCLEHAA